MGCICNLSIIVTGEHRPHVRTLEPDGDVFLLIAVSLEMYSMPNIAHFGSSAQQLIGVEHLTKSDRNFLI